jgi:hypothetical protein
VEFRGDELAGSKETMLFGCAGPLKIGHSRSLSRQALLASWTVA